MGFTLTQTFSNTNYGITADLHDGPRTAAMDSAALHQPLGFQRGECGLVPGPRRHASAGRLIFNFSIQHQLSSSMAESAYNGVLGSHLQSGLLQYNQLNPTYIQKYGISVLTSNSTSPTAIAAGVTAPFPGFNALWGTRATVAQALRPFPQYAYIDTSAGQGDHSGHSTYHALHHQVQRRLPAV